MNIKESNFYDFKGKNGISIANSQPSNFPVYKDLQPGWPLVNAWKRKEISNEEYEIRYRRDVLAKLNKEKVKADLEGKTILCHCQGDFCHRFIVLKWLKEPETPKPTLKIGIVGHGSNKFDPRTEKIAKNVIRRELKTAAESNRVIVISGHSPMAGVDIWTEEIATELGLEMDIKAPKQQSWDGEYGYKQRNLDIARCSDEVHVIVVAEYPPTYQGRRFDKCYHCAKHNEGKKIKNHVKSGGCWTGWEAFKLGKKCVWHVIK